MPDQSSTPRLRPVIRVFVSSTFSDLKPEPLALREMVLSDLQARGIMQFTNDEHLAILKEKSGL